MGTFQSVPKWFKIESERFSLVQAGQESKQNVSIFKKLYQNETKTLQIAPGFLNTKKHLVVLKKFWKRTRTKAFGQNFLVLIENVLFRSRILFQK